MRPLKPALASTAPLKSHSRIDPSREPLATTGAQSGGLLLPDFQVRHALYFNVSHAVRHLSFGTYFPGMHNPLDNIYKHSDEGAAEEGEPPSESGEMALGEGAPSARLPSARLAS